MRVTSEYPETDQAVLRRPRACDADVRLSYGASEAKIPDIADCVVDITETGRALRAAGLRVIDTILTSYTEVVANPASFADPDKRRAMDQLMTLLNGALEARGKVLLKLNVGGRAARRRARRTAVREVADASTSSPTATTRSRRWSRRTASTGSFPRCARPVPPICSRSRSARSCTER